VTGAIAATDAGATATGTATGAATCTGATAGAWASALAVKYDLRGSATVSSVAATGMGWLSRAGRSWRSPCSFRSPRGARSRPYRSRDRFSRGSEPSGRAPGSPVALPCSVLRPASCDARST
jgi:hypothetical protein